MVAAAGLVLSGPATAQWFGPKSLPECLLSELPGEVSDAVAYQKYERCRSRFPGEARPVENRRYASGGDCVIAKARGTPSHAAGNLITWACFQLYEPARPSASPAAIAPVPPPSNFFDRFDPPRR